MEEDSREKPEKTASLKLKGRSHSASRAPTERRAQERDARRALHDTALATGEPPPAPPAAFAAPPAPPAARAAPPAPPATAAALPAPPTGGGPPTPPVIATAPAPAHPATPQAAFPRRPTGSPKSDLESDYVILQRLISSRMVTEEFARAAFENLTTRKRRLQEEGARTPTEEELDSARNFAALSTIPPGTLKRQRSEYEIRTDASKRAATVPDPKPPRDPRVRRGSQPIPMQMDIETDTTTPTTEQPQPPTSPSWAGVTSSPRAGPSSASAAPPPQAPSAAAAQKKPRYPPIIVEKLPNWSYHVRKIRDKLGRTPNSRPFGEGIRFLPSEDQEYRILQKYFADLEKTERISWFSYSLPQDRSLKAAIRGIPVDTDPEELMEEFRTLGFEPEMVRPIKARKGRPGCIFFAIFKRTADLTPRIWQVEELLCMPGVRIEAWRGKKGPSQCHRCQQFRHSSHNCHRKLACVRCGQEHSAHECPRPREEPATCANCKGPHPANHQSCPVFKAETRNKRAGTVALTKSTTTTSRPAEQPASQPTAAGSANATTGAFIRTPANDPSSRDSAPKKNKKKKKKTGGKASARSAEPAGPAPPPPPPQPRASAPTRPRQEPTSHDPAPATSYITNGRLTAIEMAIQVLQDVMLALRAGAEPADVILRGMANLLSLQSHP